MVAVDQFAGAVSATQHLLELGHETVWHITGPPDFLESQRAARRLAHDARGRRRRACPSRWSATGAPSAGYELGRRLSRGPAVTAIFVANDQMALGVLRAMHEAGRAIPGELSVVGFDDIPEAPYFTAAADDGSPGLRRDGQRASLRLLLAHDRDRGAAPVAARSSPPELIVRASTERATVEPIDTAGLVIANIAPHRTREEG